MRQGVLACIVAGLSLPAMVMCTSAPHPARPDWQTDAGSCSWHWREGSGIGLWAERCRLGGDTWQVAWDRNEQAFVTRRNGQTLAIAVEVLDLPEEDGIHGLPRFLAEAGYLDPQAKCEMVAAAPRPAVRTTAFHVLSPSDPAALQPTAQGEVPEPVCGPYGASTHGVRYFMTDLRWPDRAVFIEEGQERPLFDPASITIRY